ncbi:hypothetical protein [Paenibacillus sp. LHD-38]|uniref:hypothetical protein n=1 Tax=Paenibacillus sp. LHD-38 TaxID=3072143 RepID=UPI00280C51FC|nr:hypothetical protein [Paenibacillus sp. LHD-38]MDQ8739454.1 hypothetical protein [Paenibacillus sp. LHD-38]
MEFIIKPYESAGPITIGMTKEQVRSAMSDRPEKNHIIRGTYTDFFSETCVFVYYTEENGVIEAIEFCEPTKAIINGQLLNVVPFFEAKKVLQKYDKDLVEELGSGVTSYKLRIGLYAPKYYVEDDPGTPAVAVIVFRKGYYDGLAETIAE